VPILDGRSNGEVPIPRVEPRNDYYMECKYQSNLSWTPFLFLFTLLGTVISLDGNTYFGGSNQFKII